MFTLYRFNKVMHIVSTGFLRQQPFVHMLPRSMHIDLEIEIFKCRFSNWTDRKPGDTLSRMCKFGQICSLHLTHPLVRSTGQPDQWVVSGHQIRYSIRLVTSTTY